MSTSKFRLSDDGTYWIGTTSKGHEFWFDGRKEIIEYIKSCSWRKLSDGYFQNGKGERLHRVVMEVLDNKDVFINHLNGNRWDNRRSKLSISNPLDNSKEKRVGKANSSGIVGLLKRGNNDKWVGNIMVDNLSVYTKYKIKEEALIDLLIIQKYYGYRHNENLYYMIENIDKNREKEVLDNIKRQLETKHNHKINGKNKYELSEDKTYYNVYDSKNRSFKISLQDKKLLENGLWFVSYDTNSRQECVKGSVVINGLRKSLRLNRYIFGIYEDKYRRWYVSHDNGDSLDYRRENICITDCSGNCINKPTKGYKIANDGRDKKYRSSITINNITYRKSFYNPEEAKEWFFNMRKKAFDERLCFYSKEELDEYLKNK